MDTAGWVPAGQPTTHLLPDGQLSAEGLTTQWVPPWPLEHQHFSKGAGWAGWGVVLGLKTPNGQPNRGCEQRGEWCPRGSLETLSRSEHPRGCLTMCQSRGPDPLCACPAAPGSEEK